MSANYPDEISDANYEMDDALYRWNKWINRIIQVLLHEQLISVCGHLNYPSSCWLSPLICHYFNILCKYFPAHKEHTHTTIKQMLKRRDLSFSFSAEMFVRNIYALFILIRDKCLLNLISLLHFSFYSIHLSSRHSITIVKMAQQKVKRSINYALCKSQVPWVYLGQSNSGPMWWPFKGLCIQVLFTITLDMYHCNLSDSHD
jgi:hypothetical protein